MTENQTKNEAKYRCESCDFTCCKKSNYNIHLHTDKHKKMTDNDKKMQKDATSYACTCGKQYKYRQGLHVHQKKCTPISGFVEPAPIPVVNTNEQLILELLMKNKELMEMLIVQKNNTTTINNNQTNKFNINVFLNETCKNAMNFSDFVNNIQITYEDLENNAKLGFVNGISKIFLDNLKQLDISERPIHCTDVKRETMYIRDENIWKKQTDDQILQKAIQAVSYKSMGKLAKWKQENPDYNDADSEFSQRCLIIQKHTLAGSERGVYYPKVIHALARETTVDK